jgi:Mn-containing catalase
MVGVKARNKVCRGMAGLIEEGQEMIQESKEKDSAARDLALIGAAQKVEHYEISAYCTARIMATQLGQPDVAMLLSKTLAEEENADCVLAECARPLMTEAKLAEVE